MENQAFLFVVFTINGILIGILFDIFRIFRKTFKTTDFITYIEDTLFWLFTGILTLYFIFNYNNGEIRFYIFLGIIIGITIYMISLSKYFIKISVSIINFLKSIIKTILSVFISPINIILKFIKRIFFKPISFIFINLRLISTKTMSKICKVLKKPQKLSKKVSFKKDF